MFSHQNCQVELSSKIVGLGLSHLGLLLVLARNTDKCSMWRSSKSLALIVIPCGTLAAFNPLFAVAFTNVITVLYITHTTWSCVTGFILLATFLLLVPANLVSIPLLTLLCVLRLSLCGIFIRFFF